MFIYLFDPCHLVIGPGQTFYSPAWLHMLHPVVWRDKTCPYISQHFHASCGCLQKTPHSTSSHVFRIWMPWSFVCGPKKQHISVRHWPILASVWPRSHTNHRIPFGLAWTRNLGAAKHLIGYFQTPWWYISFHNLTAATWMPMLCGNKKHL